ncbi:MAG: hypothetical protein MUE50_04395 [Pirellulaceae bacterium]|nr:hypothetical protein [Pirellulaceae bacterium]
MSLDQANSLILQAYEDGIIGARLLPHVIREWRQPRSFGRTVQRRPKPRDLAAKVLDARFALDFRFSAR